MKKKKKKNTFDFHTSEAEQDGDVAARQTDAELNWLSELGGQERNCGSCVRGLIFQIKNNNFPYQNRQNFLERLCHKAHFRAEDFSVDTIFTLKTAPERENGNEIVVTCCR